MRRCWLAVLAAVAFLFAGCAEPPFEGTGKVYELVHHPERWENRLTTKTNADGTIGVTWKRVRVPEVWAVDLLDEHGVEHRVRVDPAAWSACSIGDWYSTNTKVCR